MRGDLGSRARKSRLDGTDFKSVAFSTKVQQARRKDREAKTKE